MAKSRDERIASTAERYRDFVREARGRSPRYAELAAAVAADDEILAFLAALPKAKREPALVFAAVDSLLGGQADIGSLRGLLAQRRRELAQSILRWPAPVNG